MKACQTYAVGLAESSRIRAGLALQKWKGKDIGILAVAPRIPKPVDPDFCD